MSVSLAFGFSFLARLLLPYGGPWLISCPILQALSRGTLQRDFSAGNVIDTNRNAVAVPEIALIQISVQMLLFAMLIDALHAALEDLIVAFDSVGRDDLIAFITDVFVL